MKVRSCLNESRYRVHRDRDKMATRRLQNRRRVAPRFVEGRMEAEWRNSSRRGRRGITNRSDSELRSQILKRLRRAEESVVVAGAPRIWRREGGSLQRHRAFARPLDGSPSPPIDIARSRQACLTSIESIDEPRATRKKKKRSIIEYTWGGELYRRSSIRDLHVTESERFVARRSAPRKYKNQRKSRRKAFRAPIDSSDVKGH